MISYNEAINIILAKASAPKAVHLPLMEALGKIAAADVASPIQVPSFRNSAIYWSATAICRR